MSTSMGVAVGYRTLQAICDLRHVALKANDGTYARMAEGLAGTAKPEDLRLIVERDGCRLTAEMAATAHQALVLAATLPEEDFEAFRTATAVLLADRLQRGAGTDDLFWHWDAFEAHYRLLSPADRAAIMQGFRRANAEGLMALFDPPDDESLLTENDAALAERLEVLAGDAEPVGNPARPDFAARTAALIVRAFDHRMAASGAANAWTRHASAVLGLEEPARSILVRGFRHLYEGLPDWTPYRGQTFDPAGPLPPMLPVLSR